MSYNGGDVFNLITVEDRIGFDRLYMSVGVKPNCFTEEPNSMSVKLKLLLYLPWEYGFIPLI